MSCARLSSPCNIETGNRGSTLKSSNSLCSFVGLKALLSGNWSKLIIKMAFSTATNVIDRTVISELFEIY